MSTVVLHDDVRIPSFVADLDTFRQWAKSDDFPERGRLEVVSKSSFHKDTVVLRKLYWQAGIPEYWLVGVRREQLQFDILKRGRHGYTAPRKRSGWVKSAVLECSFRLTSGIDAAGNPEYILEMV
jgi:hypothetical protein